MSISDKHITKYMTGRWLLLLLLTTQCLAIVADDKPKSKKYEYVMTINHSEVAVVDSNAGSPVTRTIIRSAFCMILLVSGLSLGLRISCMPKINSDMIQGIHRKPIS